MESGKYLGLGPTRDSLLPFGEVELEIDADYARMRQATGRTIVTLFEVPRDALIELSSDEVAAKFNAGADTEEVRGWRVGDTAFEILLHPELDSYDHTPRLVVFGLPAQKLIKQPATLFLPSQWECGLHAIAIAEFEKAAGLPVGVPRLALGGRPPTITTS